MIWKSLDPRIALIDAIGVLPDFLSELDKRSAVEQLAAKYCGGWHDMKVGKYGFSTFDDFKTLHYPGDPVLHALAETVFHRHVMHLPTERIVVYESAFVAVIAEHGSFRVSRLD